MIFFTKDPNLINKNIFFFWGGGGGGGSVSEFFSLRFQISDKKKKNSGEGGRGLVGGGWSK